MKIISDENIDILPKYVILNPLQCDVDDCIEKLMVYDYIVTVPEYYMNMTFTMKRDDFHTGSYMIFRL